jgi:predicted nucleic acid-binding protein
MSESLTVYVFDTSAWLTLIEDEAGADTVQDLLEKAQAGEAVLLTSFMSYMEVYYITLQERDADEARARIDLMTSLPVLRIESSNVLGFIAADIKAHHRLSVADAWVSALAREQEAVLVHKDPEFDQVKTLIELLPLPYKV